MEKYKELKLQNESLKKEMKQFEKCDPARVDEIRSKITICKASCDRWVDNIFQVISWMTKQNPGITASDLAMQFPVTKELDYLDFETRPATP